MLLAGFRQFNLGALWFLFLLAASAAAADEIHRWRDAEGKLHVTITGAPDEGRSGGEEAQESTMDPAQRFSVETSLRRRDLEKRLQAASAELTRVRERLREVESRRLVVYSPPAPKEGENSQFVLDAQRNAFLQVRAFERERRDQLRKLRRDERDWLTEILRVWKEFETLRAEVKSAYGTPPSWWRDHLDCPGCLAAREAEAALQEPKKGRSSSALPTKDGEEPQPEKESDD